MIYIHIGLPKTATTFMQEQVFPNWDDIEYLGRHIGQDVTIQDIVKTISNGNKYILSCESLSGLGGWRGNEHHEKNKTLKNLSAMFPDAKILVSFRRHDKWMLSYYKQSIRSGQTLTWDYFFDINSKNGLLDVNQFKYKHYLDIIEECFENKPFIFLQEELLYNFDGLLSDLSLFFDSKEPYVNRNAVNEAMGYYQILLLLQFNKLFKSPRNMDGLLPYNKFTNYLYQLLKRLCLSLNFYQKSLEMSAKQKVMVKDYYLNDWLYLLDYIQNKCPSRQNFNQLSYQW